MTSTMQIMRTPAQMTVQEQWKTIFPNFTTLTGSKNFMKKLVAVSLSAITYFRGVFPDKAYGERHLCGLKLKILTDDSKFEGVNKFINLIKSCYDAIDKKYLCQLSVGICTDVEKSDEVLEAYHLNFRYSEDENVPVPSNSNYIDENNSTVVSTLSLLKNIYLVSDLLGPLPKNVYLTMKLLYNDEITPSDYEPPGFEPSSNEKFLFPTSAVKLEVGKISTDLHGYKMYVKTALSKEPLSQLLDESVFADTQEPKGNAQQPMEEDSIELNPKTQMKYQSSDFKENSIKVKNLPGKIDCPCACKEDSGIGILECTFCGQKQHSICYGILNPERNESEFYCVQCISEAPTTNVPEDLIYTCEGNEQQELCALRRALVFCSSLKHVTVYQLEKGLKCSKELSKTIIEKLEFDGFIRRSGQKYIVNERKIISIGYCEYFPRHEEKENMKYPQASMADKFREVPDEEIVTARKRKSHFKENRQSTSEDYVDDSLDKVKDLKLEHTTDNQLRRSRRSMKAKVQSDDSQDFLPAKRRCINTKSPIILQ